MINLAFPVLLVALSAPGFIMAGDPLAFDTCVWRYAEASDLVTCEDDEVAAGFCSEGCGSGNNSVGVR